MLKMADIGDGEFESEVKSLDVAAKSEQISDVSV